VTGTTITKTWADTSLDDISVALTASIANDGQTPVLADLPMATFKHTGVGNASARNQYAAVGQVQDGSFIWCGTAGGTANAITLTPTPAITAYAAGQTFIFKAGANSSSSTITFAISGLSTIAGQVNFAACTTGDIVANKLYSITLDTTSTAQINQIGNIASTFTPALKFGGSSTGITYSQQVGNWSISNGRLFFDCHIVLSSKGAQTGAATVSGLPFVVGSAGASSYFVGSVFASNLTFSGQIAVGASFGNAAFEILQFASGGASASVTDAGFANNTSIYASGSYQL